MDNSKKYTFQAVSLLVLAPLMFAGARTTHQEITMTAPELPALNATAQQLQATELSSEADLSQHDLRREILHAVKASIPAKFQHRSFEIARAVITEANHHNMDPFFLLAVIKTESHFNIQARGTHGEVGLMQILPVTANWLAAQAGLAPGQFNLEDPRINIRLGATYFASLRKQFKNNSARYIGAYNMGSGNVYRLMENQLVPTEYPGRVLKNYRSFYKSAANRLTEVATRKLASVSKSVEVQMPKKLQTRNLINKCGVNRCKQSAQPLMPGWTTT